MAASNIILCKLKNSGNSVIDPILRELLSRKGYFITPVGPEGTPRLRDNVEQQLIQELFYHATHDPVAIFDGMACRSNYRFIHRHRGLRDVATSWGHDLQRRGAYEDTTYPQILDMLVVHNSLPHVKSAVRSRSLPGSRTCTN